MIPVRNDVGALISYYYQLPRISFARRRMFGQEAPISRPPSGFSNSICAHVRHTINAPCRSDGAHRIKLRPAAQDASRGPISLCALFSPIYSLAEGCLRQARWEYCARMSGADSQIAQGIIAQYHQLCVVCFSTLSRRAWTLMFSFMQTGRELLHHSIIWCAFKNDLLCDDALKPM